MKKSLILWSVLLCSCILIGCQSKRHIQDLQSLQSAVSLLQQQVLSGTVDIDDAERQVDTLMTSYQELTQQEIASSMQSFTDILQAQKKEIQRLWTLPVWATQLWLTVPQGMKLQKALSHQEQGNTTGYDTLVLVYKGSYDVALQEAQRIASGAKLFLSPEIVQAQAMVKSWGIVSGFNTKDLMDAVIYTNHRLLDSNVATIISVSVTKEWLLTLEATNYKK